MPESSVIYMDNSLIDVPYIWEKNLSSGDERLLISIRLETIIAESPDCLGEEVSI